MATQHKVQQVQHHPQQQVVDPLANNLIYAADGSPVYIEYKAKYKAGYLILWTLVAGIPGIAGYCIYKHLHGKRKDARLRAEFMAMHNRPMPVTYPDQPVVVEVHQNAPRTNQSPPAPSYPAEKADTTYPPEKVGATY